MVKFSVIIPTLNEEQNIKECLESLLEQDTDESYEVIVSDSNSEDNTKLIAKKYAHKVINCSKGISVGRNSGAKVSEGEILIFIDADSVASPRLLSSYSEVFENDKIIAATGPIFPKENIKSVEGKFLEIGTKLYTESWMKFLIKIGKPTFIGSNCAFRKDKFFEVGGFKENLKTFEDGDLSIRLTGRGDFAFHNEAKVFTSIRRLKKWGYFKFIKFHTTNSIKYIFFNKPHEDYEEVR